MKNLKITEHFRGAMYSNITKERLNEVLSSG